ncbi:chaperonin-like RBCX protein 1, chloroplastic [Solanum dulcamara]|uniref:chaperonin-like RBCX protein 1, chloroplastic n=1 Tax=Solanum dulcamara TaxID=45834 RepID=UPI002485DFDC|nr:chaperonin-like RBCX protein 1, chloroplastic [Solanum dulcamara]
MEYSSTAIVFSQLSLFPSTLQTENKAYLFKPWKQRTCQSTRFQCHKMYVPGFGKSPESTAAQHLHHFFNFIAVKIVAAQLESYNPEAYEELREFLDKHSLSDGDKFCADLMRESPRHKNLALRILEVRSTYCKDDFEWDNLKRLASKMVDDSNKKLMTDYIVDTSCIADGK